MFRNMDTVIKAKGSLAALASALLFERPRKADFQLGYSVTLGRHLDCNTR
jgi:hypothetical protein